MDRTIDGLVEGDRGAGSRPPAWALVGGGMALGLSLAAMLIWIASWPVSLGYDMVLLQSAARRLLAGEPLYLDPAGALFAPGSLELYYGPPALAIVSLPLVLLDEPMVRLLAMPLSIATVLIVLCGLVFVVRSQVSPTARLSLIVGTIASFAVFGGATLGATSIVLLFLLGVACVALVRPSWPPLGVLWDPLAAICIGSAIAFRLYPAVLLVPLVIAGRSRLVVASGLVALAWVAVGAVVAGVDQTIQYAGLARALSGLGSPPASVTPAGLATAWGWPPALGAAIKVGTLVLGAATLVAAGILVRRTPPGPDRIARQMCAWGLACSGMLLLMPVVWDHYLTALLPLVVGLIAVTRRAVLGLLPILWFPGAPAGATMVALPVAALAAMRRAGFRRVRNQPRDSARPAGQGVG